MATEPESPALRTMIAADQAASRLNPGLFKAFLGWAADRQAQYERERRAWRAAHPLVDVGALEAQYGVQADILTTDQLRASAPTLLIGPEAEEGP
jgi:hypothetical protein